MLGTAPLVIAALAAALLIVLLLRLVCFSSAAMKAAATKIKKIVVWNAFIRYWLLEYTTIAIASLLKLYALDFANWYEAAMSGGALAGIVAVAATPFLIGAFLYKKHEQVPTPEFAQKYGSLTADLQVHDKAAMLYHVAFTLRRAALAVLIVVVPHYNWLQTQMVIFTCSLVLIFVGIVRPFARPLLNHLELINETFVLSNTYFVIIYSDFVPEPEVRYGAGWVNCALLLVMILTNLCSILFHQVGACKHWCRLRGLKREYEKNMAYRETRLRLQLSSTLGTAIPQASLYDPEERLGEQFEASAQDVSRVSEMSATEDGALD